MKMGLSSSKSGWDFRTKEEKIAAEERKKALDEETRQRNNESFQEWVRETETATGVKPVNPQSPDFKQTALYERLVKISNNIIRHSGIDGSYLSKGVSTGRIIGKNIEFIQLDQGPGPFPVSARTHKLAYLDIKENKEKELETYLKKALPKGTIFIYYKTSFFAGVHVFTERSFINADLIKKGIAKYNHEDTLGESYHRENPDTIYAKTFFKLLEADQSS